MISQVFTSKFQHIHITSVSVHNMRLVFKICQTFESFSITSQFHELSNVIFGVFFPFWAIVGRPAAFSLSSCHGSLSIIWLPQKRYEIKVHFIFIVFLNTYTKVSNNRVGRWEFLKWLRQIDSEIIFIYITRLKVLFHTQIQLHTYKSLC